MPFFEANPTAPTRVAARVRRTLAQNRQAAVERRAGWSWECPPDCGPRDDVSTTVDATIRPVGNHRYRRLGWGPGEPHRLRDVFDIEPSDARSGHRRSLLYFAQHTDLHLCDTQAEARLVGGQAFGWLHPGSDAAHRPQEVMATHVFDQLIRATNRVRVSPLSGASMAWCAQTGDHTDNRLAAPVGWWLDLLAGRTIVPNTGERGRYEGIQRSGWRTVWNPDRAGGDRPQRHGYPHLPGVLDAAVAPFDSEGLAMPWLALLGNHDQIFSGTFGPTRGVRVDRVEAMVRDSGLAPITGWALIEAVTRASLPGLRHAKSWRRRRPGLGVVRVASDAQARRPIDSRAFLGRILDEDSSTGGVGPPGHGFTAKNLAEATSWWSRSEGARIQVIGLDTNNHTIGDEGRIGPRQAAWLEAELRRHHSRYRDVDGNWVSGNGIDRLVVIMSHHNSWSLKNDHDDVFDPGRPLGREGLLRLLSRFPNVVLWFSGHSHQHRIAPHPTPGAPHMGFWEVTTSSVIEGAQQGRTFEIFDNGDRTLSIVTTVFDHRAPPAVEYPGPDGWTPMALASLSRELAANDDRWFDPTVMSGSVWDRNVELPLAAPDWLTSV